MQQIISSKIEELEDFVSACTCGKRHALGVKRLVFRENGIEEIAEIASEIMPFGRILLVIRDDAVNMTASKAQSLLSKSGYNLIVHCYSEEIVCSMDAGSQLFGYPEDVRLAVAIGDGAICSLTKYFGSVKNVPVVCIPTDCDCSSVLIDSAFMYVGGVMHAVKTATPYAAIYDFDVISESSRGKLASAFGDNMASFITLFDRFFASAVRGEKYCNAGYETLVSLVSNNLDKWETFARGERAGILENLDCTVRLSILRKTVPEFAYSSADYVAAVFDMIKNSKSRMVRAFGETKFYLARKLAGIYALLTASKIRDLGFPPDKGLHADVIDRLFDVGRFEALKSLDYSVNTRDYSMDMYRYEEYREDLRVTAVNVASQLESASKGFKRISTDLGYSLMRNMATGDVKLALALAPDIFAGYTALTFLRDMGLLEGYLR